MSEDLSRPFTAASFNRYLTEKKLMGSRCQRCNAVHLPPRAICPRCHAEVMDWVEMQGRGKLAAFTAVYIAPTFMIAQEYGRDNPYLSGIVELDEGVKISALITGLDARDPAGVEIGTPLVADFLQQGEGEAARTRLAFRPAG